MRTTPGAATDTERKERIRDALSRAGLDAVVCALPKHVLLLSGYWPVVGTALAIATREGGMGIIAPTDELELARRGRATELLSFDAGTLEDIRTAGSAVQAPLTACLRTLGLQAARIGFEAGEAVQAASYAALHLYGSCLSALLAHAAPHATFVAADAMLAELCAVLTARAADADRAARSVLEQSGFGSGFTHSTGHGVGFVAIDHTAIPRLHPKSEDVLEPGMVFNVEPAIYHDGVCGIRHCDVVVLDDTGPRVLTPFHATMDDLILNEH